MLGMALVLISLSVFGGNRRVFADLKCFSEEVAIRGEEGLKYFSLLLEVIFFRLICLLKARFFYSF